MEYNIAFSSSGARFAAHIGVLAYFQDNNILVKNYSGTSGGAVVAAWGANNLPARKLMDLTLQFGYAQYIIKLSFIPGGILDHSLFGKTIASYCEPKNNLWITTFNILKMQKEIWNGKNFNLSKVLIATTSIPGLFRPVIYSNGVHIDGIFARFCPDDLWDEGTTISVQLKSKHKTTTRYPFDNFIHSIEKATIDFLEEKQKNNSTRRNLIYIEPDVSSIAQMDLFTIEPEDHIQLFKKGYEGAKRVVENNMFCYINMTSDKLKSLSGKFSD